MVLDDSPGRQVVHAFLWEAPQSHRLHIHLNRFLSNSLSLFNFLWPHICLEGILFLFEFWTIYNCYINWTTYNLIIFINVKVGPLTILNLYKLDHLQFYVLNWPELSLTVPLPSDRLRKVTWCWNMGDGIRKVTWCWNMFKNAFCLINFRLQ